MHISLFIETHKSLIKNIFISIILILFISLVIFNLKNDEDSPKIPFYSSKKSIWATSSDNVFKISYDKKYKLEEKDSKDYVISLTNKDGFKFLISKINSNGFNLHSILTSDRKNFIKAFNNVENASEIETISYSNLNGFVYSFNFSDDSKKFKAIELASNLNGKDYMFDIIFPLNQTNYNVLINDIINSLEFIE